MNVGGETGRNSNAHPHTISSVVMIVRDVGAEEDVGDKEKWRVEKFMPMT
jgi:hypothetical protein